LENAPSQFGVDAGESFERSRTAETSEFAYFRCYRCDRHSFVNLSFSKLEFRVGNAGREPLIGEYSARWKPASMISRRAAAGVVGLVRSRVAGATSAVSSHVPPS
jgi:hypothetical protein